MSSPPPVEEPPLQVPPLELPAALLPPEAATSPEAPTLGTTAARGAVITTGGQILQVVMQIASVVVLARLLSPTDYGLYATVLVVVGVGEIFRDFGLSSAAVQAKTLSRFQRDNLFWVNLGIGVALTLLAIVLAPAFAALFNEPALTGITRVLSFTFLINAIATQHRAGLNRDLRFGQLALTDLLAQFIGLTVAIVCAALGAGYWSLVASQLAQVSTVLVLVLVFARWLPRWWRRGQPMRSFLIFGRNYVATSLVGYLGNNVDATTIALRFGAAPLGIYTRAFQLVMNPLNQFRAPATTVALPVLSRLQDDLGRANEYLRRGQLAMGYTIVAALAIGAGAATPIVDLMLGPTWHQTIPIFALLAISGILQTIAYVGYWAYLSRGLTADLFRYTILTTALLAACIVIGSQWGVNGVAAGFTVAYAIEWPLSLWWLSRRTVYPVRALYSGASRILVTGGLAGLASFGVCRALASAPNVVILLCAAAAGLCVYLLCALLSGRVREDLGGVRDIGRRVLHR